MVTAYNPTTIVSFADTTYGICLTAGYTTCCDELNKYRCRDKALGEPEAFFFGHFLCLNCPEVIGTA